MARARRSPRRGPKPKLDLDQIVEAAIERRRRGGPGAAVDAQGRRAAGRRDDVALHLRPGQGGAARPDGRRDASGRQRTSTAPWRERLERIARENWERYHRHPWLLEITMVRPVLGPNVIARYDHELQAIDGIGLTDVEMDAVVTPARRPRRGRGPPRARGGARRAPDRAERPGSGGTRARQFSNGCIEPESLSRSRGRVGAGGGRGAQRRVRARAHLLVRAATNPRRHRGARTCAGFGRLGQILRTTSSNLAGLYFSHLK